MIIIKHPILEIYPCIQGEGGLRGMPVLAIRTTGCTHRCYFGEVGGWCDSWYTSIHAEKGRYSIEGVEAALSNHPQIHALMVTGGSPTMHPELLEALMELAYTQKLHVTLETEGSHFVSTTHKIDLISLSPKFSNTIPRLGDSTPKGRKVDEKMISQHNKYRLNLDVIHQMLEYHLDYQIKPVITEEESGQVISELLKFCEVLKIPKGKVYLMPGGQTQAAMRAEYAYVSELALHYGFSFTGRDHIIAYGDQRGV